MANRQASVQLFLQALQNAGSTAMQISNLQRQQQQDAMRKQLIDLQAQEQKMRLDALKLEQNKMKARDSFRQTFFERLQNPQAPNEPLEPTGAAQGSPRGSALIANQSRIATGQEPVSDQERGLQLAALAGQAGETPLLNSLIQQGFVSSPSGDLQRQAQETSLEIQESQLDATRNIDSVRQELSDSLKKHARKLKGIDKQRFEMASVAMKTAGPPQMASMIQELFPSFDEPTTAFQAMLRKFGDPEKTLKVMGDIEVENQKKILAGKPKTPRSYGNDREAEAAALYGGRAFQELTPGEQKRVNDTVFNNRIKLEQARMTGGRLPPDARREISVIRSLSGSVKELQAAFRPEFVGKFNFVGNKIRVASGQASPELIAFASLHENLVDQLARERTGAVIGQQEAAQFRRIIGSQFDEPAVFLSRLERFGKTLEMQEGNVLDLSLKTGEELQTERDESRLQELSKKNLTDLTDNELLELQRLMSR